MIDTLIVESTYGNRLHSESDPMLELEKLVRRGAERRGVILIPAFAVGRAQTLLYYLAQLKKAARIPDIPMFLNSPMATNVTDVLCTFKSLHKLSDIQCDEICKVLHYVRTSDDSKILNTRRGPMLIISASGMATGGRILHHLKEFAPDPKNIIVLTGFQAAGTRGRALEDGAKEIKIHGQFVPVRAEVTTLENLSAHADYSEIIEWLERSRIRPRQVFVTHGEPEAAIAMRNRLIERFGWNCTVPAENQVWGEDGCQTVK